jgi:hypothetical protein
MVDRDWRLAFVALRMCNGVGRCGVSTRTRAARFIVPTNKYLASSGAGDADDEARISRKFEAAAAGSRLRAGRFLLSRAAR